MNEEIKPIPLPDMSRMQSVIDDIEAMHQRVAEAFFIEPHLLYAGFRPFVIVDNT